jgi:hypothetical protein
LAIVIHNRRDHIQQYRVVSVDDRVHGLAATAGGLLLVHAHIYAPVLPFVITVAAVATAAIFLRERGKSD